MDGADINDSGSNGTITNTPSIDAIQEFTLERSNYDASFGRSGGGQVVVATKSGSNQFHGTAYEFNRNNLYNANNAANKISIAQGGWCRSPDNSLPRSSVTMILVSPSAVPSKFPDFPSGQEQAFFFVSEEWRYASSPQIQTATVPTKGQLGGHSRGS